MQERRPQGSGAVLLGGEQFCSTPNRPKLQANERMIARLNLLLWTSWLGEMRHG